jgi:predicted RNase H-like nuclease (RuvC/YqgF family)
VSLILVATEDSQSMPTLEDNDHVLPSHKSDNLSKAIGFISSRCINDDCQELISDLKVENKSLKLKLKHSKEKLIKSEEKAHEYYEIYHKLLLEHRGLDDASKRVHKENTHLSNQLEILSRHTGKLERKLASFVGKSCGTEFELCSDQWAKSLIVTEK